MLGRSSTCLGGLFDLDGLKSELVKIKDETSASDLWDDKDRAQTLLQKQTEIEKSIENFEKVERDFVSAKELSSMISKEGDPDLEKELIVEFNKIVEGVQELEIICLFSGEADSCDAFLEIHAGAGGTESHDWAEMLQRMYIMFAEKNGFKLTLLAELAGEDAGIKSVTMKISGDKAFGWLKTESGVHRLVRISPFNAAGKRQTSFASVWIYPVVDDNIEIEIEECDIRIDTYKASGAGGQHVNTTDSAVRITHIPTNIVVQSQSNRSQHKNRAEARSMLKARLYELELRKKEEKLQQSNAQKTDNGWGNQIRSYVLHPYKMVKDHRSSFETSNPDAILNGGLKEMILTNLVYHLKKEH
jgi:peptide chain release factor 2